VGLGHPTAAAVEAGVEGEVHRARGGGPGAAHRGAVVHRGAGGGGDAHRGEVGVAHVCTPVTWPRRMLERVAQRDGLSVEGVAVVVVLVVVAVGRQRAVSTLFPYTTLFRSVGLGHPTAAAVEAGVEGEVHRARGGGPGAAHRGAVVHRGAGGGGDAHRG